MYYYYVLLLDNDLETVNYKTNERKGTSVGKHTCHVSGFWDR